MLEYASYEDYKNIYKGSLDISLFNSLIPKASREIDKAVNRELKEADITDKVKYVVCELVDYLDRQSRESNLSSIQMGSVSKTYKSIKEQDYSKEKILSGLPLELTRFL